MRIVVVGAGVIGLTCAVTLAEAGHSVSVLARDLPLETTSAVAAAWWYPYLALPRDRVTGWSRRSYDRFVPLCGVADSGVSMRRSIEVSTSVLPTPWWAEAVPDLRPARSVPRGYASGWEFTSVVVEMGVYLPHLVSRLRAADGDLTRAALSALPTGADLVVNAAGLGNRWLLGDRGCEPVRGQILRVSQVGLEEVWLDERDGAPTYVVPRRRDVVIGGTEERNDWSLTPRPETADAIWSRACSLVPALASATVLSQRVGLRPARAQVRVEREDRIDASPVVHCYGHGRAGVTLSWGCAEEVAELANGEPAADAVAVPRAGAQNKRSDGSSMPRRAS